MQYSRRNGTNDFMSLAERLVLSVRVCICNGLHFVYFHVVALYGGLWWQFMPLLTV